MGRKRKRKTLRSVACARGGRLLLEFWTIIYLFIYVEWRRLFLALNIDTNLGSQPENEKKNMYINSLSRRLSHPTTLDAI
jgi:hypothetical protein